MLLRRWRLIWSRRVLLVMVGSAAGDAGSLSADELAARGIESPEATQNHLDAVIQAGAGGDTSSTDDGSSGGGASSQASGEGLKGMTYMPVVVAAKPVKSASFWQDGDAESASSTLELNTAAVLDIGANTPGVLAPKRGRLRPDWGLRGAGPMVSACGAGLPALR